MDQNIKAPTTSAGALTNRPVNSNVFVEKMQANGDDYYPPIEPWHESVSGQELADEINSIFRKYVSLPDGASDALTLWVLHTYIFNAFEYTPRICIISPEKRCGKTLVLQILESLSFHPLNVSNITAASAFRFIDEHKPTMLIDEADSFFKKSDELRGVVNAGYKWNGAVLRCVIVGKNIETKKFLCFAPCALASIGRLQDTIMDRAVIITMERKKETESVALLRSRILNDEVCDLRRKCIRFMIDIADEAGQLRPELPSWLNDRESDIWEPLFSIAALISDKWRDKAYESAKILTRAQDDMDKESTRTQLLSDIRTVFAEEKSDWLASKKLIELLNEIDDSPWGDYNHGNGINASYLGFQLRQFRIKSEQVWRNGIRCRGFGLEMFSDVFRRYLSDPESDCAVVPPVEKPDSAQMDSNPPEPVDWHDGTTRIGECVSEQIVDSWP
jgi:hypothetical protein